MHTAATELAQQTSTEGYRRILYGLYITSLLKIQQMLISNALTCMGLSRETYVGTKAFTRLEGHDSV